MKTLLAPGEALALVLERVRPLETELVPVGEALGRVLVTEARSADDVPPFDNSAMDGFAVRASDTAEADPKQPVVLRVVGESRAGKPASATVGGGEAIRISTGAMLPRGADAIVRIEDCRAEGESVAVQVEVAPGREVRRAGEDIRGGEVVLPAGSLLGPAELGVAASVGAGELACARTPRVAVITTGDELVEPGRPLAAGQIRNTNSYSVAAQARAAGADVVSVAHAPDQPEAVAAAIERGLEADVLIVCGGVSVGPHDHVKEAFADRGVEEVFWGVALRPGHPTWFGAKERASEGATTLVFGLPGNPVSTMVTFHLFVRPALAALQNASVSRRTATAVMDADYGKRPGRAHAVRCRLEARDDGWHVRPTKAQGSHVLTSMLGARALALLEVERGDVKAGERVDIELL